MKVEIIMNTRDPYEIRGFINLYMDSEETFTNLSLFGTCRVELSNSEGLGKEYLRGSLDFNNIVKICNSILSKELFEDEEFQFVYTTGYSLSLSIEPC